MERMDPGRDVKLLLTTDVTEGEARTAVRSRCFANAGPLSPIQEAAWANRSSEREEGLDLVQAIGTLYQAVDPERLEESWRRVVSRHPGLKIGIHWKDAPEPIQEVHPEVGGILEHEDWSGRPETEREAMFEKWLQDDRAQGFDLDRPPLVRLRLFRFSEREFRLVWTYHRILLDMRSIATVIREVLDGRGEDPASTQEQISVPDPEMLRDWPDAQAYWPAILRGFRAPTSLVIDRAPEAPAATRAWGEKETVLPAGVGRALRNLAASQGASLEALLQGAWALLLHRYGGEPDVWIGVRSPAGFERAEDLVAEPIGNFTNVLPTRMRINESMPVRPWLRSLGAEEAAAQPFQETPLPRIQSWSELDPGLPLFQSLLVLEGPSIQAQLRTRDDVRTGDFRLLERTGCPVTVYCHPESELTIRLVYEKGRIEEGAAARTLGHFARLLEGIAEDPNSTLAALPWMSDAELAEARSWNETSAEVPSGRVTDLFEAQAARTPDRIAVTYGDSAWTYRALDRRANQVARYLAKKGVGPGARVGLLMEASPEMVAGLLGILKAGAAYVPLDPAFPAERLRYMTQNAGLSLLVTQRRLRSVLASRSLKTVCLDSAWARVAAKEGHAPRRPGNGDSDAYVIYTSGSTGRPKGVCIPHSALVNFLWSMRSEPGMRAEDVLLAVTTISFDIAGLELFLPLITGARVALIDRRVATDAVALAESIAEIGPTVMQATPSTWQMLVEAGWKGDPALKILSGGEPLSRGLADRLLERSASVWNLYGPTETTIWSTAHRVAPGSGSVAIGRPIANTVVYVLDGLGRQLPVGIPGELYIGGAGVARGYWNRPEVTAQKFVESPFPETPGGRLYRTGDIVRYLPDGSLDCMGRADHQVKIRGFRIEPAEVEHALSRHPSVRRSIVVARRNGGDAPRLVAYLIVDRDREPGTEELRAFLARTLPDFMIPSAFVLLDEFPLTPNKKVDRGALPPPSEERPGLAAAPASPVHESERLLVRLWEAVLRVRPVGIHDNFFDLGGDSLLALRLFTRIEKLTGKKLPLATLLQAPTVSTLAPYLTGSGPVSWRSLVTIQSGRDRPRLFCVPGVGGNAVGYHVLASYLGPDQPVFGLQALGLDGRTEPLVRVEDMAAHYIQEIRGAGFRGPYHLAGASFGGLVVFEMARQLQAAGEDVGIVALLDTEAPRTRSALPGTSGRSLLLQGYRARLRFHFRRVFLEPGRLEHLGRKIHTVARRLRTRGWQVAYGICERYARRLPTYFRSVEQAGYLAGRRYSPQPAPIEVQLYRARIRPVDDSGDPLMGWERLANGDVTVIDVPADHLSILSEPAVSEVALNLLQSIDEMETLRTRRSGPTQ